MAKIIDPDSLTQGTEIVFDTVNKTIQLLAAGNLDVNDGATLQSVYSFCKEEWKDDATLIKLPFPIEAITEAKFDLINGWDWADATTRQLIRDGGWSLRDNAGVSQEEYFGFITLGQMNDPLVDRAYYLQELGGTTLDTVYTGPVNEPVKIFENGVSDFRTFFTAYLREQGKIYSQSSLEEQAVTDIDYTVYKLPLANALDPKISATDTDISTTTPYTNMLINYLRGSGFEAWVSSASYNIDDVVQATATDNRWYRAITTHSGVTTDPSADATNWESFIGERQIGASWYPFNIIVDGANALAESIYEFTQYSNRQPTDINDDTLTETFGPVTGETATQLLSFLGDTLVTGDGVYIDNFNSNDTNRIEFSDVSGTTRTFPFVAAGTINFNENLQNDASAKYWVFFADPDGTPATNDEYGTTGAIIVNDNLDSPITGLISGSPSVSFTFDYDGNSQGGRTPATDANVVVVALGLESAQYVSLTGIISRSVGLSFSLVAALERNYANPT